MSKQMPKPSRKQRRATNSGRIGATDCAVMVVPRSIQSVSRQTVRGYTILYADGVTAALLWGSGSAIPTVQSFLALSDRWAGLATVYDQYRIMSMRFDMQPRNRYSKAVTTTSGAFAIGLDVTGQTTISSAIATGYKTSKVFSTDEPGEVVFQLPQDASQPWANIDGSGALVPIGTLPVWSYAALTTSYTYMDVVFEYELLFRGDRAA